MIYSVDTWRTGGGTACQQASPCTNVFPKPLHFAPHGKNLSTVTIVFPREEACDLQVRLKVACSHFSSLHGQHPWSIMTKEVLSNEYTCDFQTFTMCSSPPIQLYGKCIFYVCSGTSNPSSSCTEQQMDIQYFPLRAQEGSSSFFLCSLFAQLLFFLLIPLQNLLKAKHHYYMETPYTGMPWYSLGFRSGTHTHTPQILVSVNTGNTILRIREHHWFCCNKKWERERD